METREMKKSGIHTSLLGFGCMRFPTLPDGSIDEAAAEKMLDEAMAKGVNYYDTAFPYHNGDSEPFVGRVLDKYDRSSYYLATKLPIWEVKSRAHAQEIFDSQLKRLNKDYVDFYLIHALDRRRFQKMKELQILDLCEEMRQAGKLRYIGFSFHDKYDAFEEILKYYDWDFCQIQYNYMDTEENPGDRGYELTEKMGIPLVVMEPVRGGLLAGFSEDIEEMFRSTRPDKSIASWAVRWVASHPNVRVILSGMSTLEQVRDNLDTFSDFQPLSEEEQHTVHQVVDTLHARIRNKCTGCRYCMPCPMGVNIPRNFHMWNDYHIYQKYGVVKNGWEQQPEKEKPLNCIECGKCEAQCPQKIAIREDLKRVQQDLEHARLQNKN